MNWIIKQLRKELWSPEAAGVGLGLVYILGVWLLHHTPGTTGTIFKISSILGKPLTADDPMNTFFSIEYTPITDGMTWQAWLLIGLFLGAMTSALLTGRFRFTMIPAEQWKDVYGSAIWKRWLMVFFGAVLLSIGAALAGGCTSGLALAGGVQLSPAAFLFIPAVFITGTVVQWLLYRRNY